MASIYEEKAEALNAENLERRKIESIANLLSRKADYVRKMEFIDGEIKRIEESNLANFNFSENQRCMSGSSF